MKKIFSLFAAALMSAVMFAGNLVPGDTILWTKGDATEVFGEGTIANGNRWRDLAYYDGVIYAIAHSQDASGKPRIYKFDAETGSYLGNMDVSAVWGGDIALASLQILDNGEVIAMGCRVTSATDGVPIYYWDSVQGVSHELMRATIANGGKRVEMLHYEGTLADGKIYLAAEKCDTITVIPVVNKAVVADQISYITLTSGTTKYIGFAPRVINVTDTTISICSSTKAMTYKISDGSCLTWTDLTGADQEGGNGVAFFEYNNEKYWATVKMGNVSAATLANACVQVQTYTGLGRWGASGVVQKYCSAADLLPSEVRNTSFTTGVAVRVNEDGYSVWACSVNQGIIAYRYVNPVDYKITVNTTAAGDFKITSANCTDVLNDGGSFKFDNATKTITLTNCHFTSETFPLIINQSVNIVLVGENSITSTGSATALKFASGDATIGGGGKLTLSCVNTGGADGIYCPDGNLTINECEIYAEGGYGIEGTSARTLTINPGAKVTAYGPNKGSFTGWGSIVLGEGIQILSPAGAQIVGGDVKDAEGALLKSQVVIGVPAEETIPATSVTLDQDTLKMYVGVGTATLKATVLPDNTTDFVEWSVVEGGESFVSVLSGIVTALAEGEAKVVAKAGDVADTCVVVVGPAPVDYNITVNTTAAGDFKITSANCTDVLNDGGSFKFDNATKTITLTNCHFTSDNFSLTINQSVNIVLVGENSITCTISATALKFASGDATIGGGGKLTLSCVNNGGADGIYCPGGNLTINECEIYAEGGYGIEGASTRTLTINPGAKVTAYGPNKGSFTGWGSIVLGEGIQILSPAGAQIVGGDVKDAEGALLKSEVVIGTPEAPVAPEGNGLNPYAYALSSEMTSDDVFTIHYSLNNNAVAGRILLKSGESTKAIALADDQLWLGAHSVAIPVSEMPEGSRVSWSIEISGNSPAAPVQETRMYSMYCPHGVAVDTNPESEYFGRILATEAMDKVKTLSGYISAGANNGAGIYAFAPDFTQIMNGENAVFNGGLNLERLISNNGYAPMRVRISEDGRIFATSCDTNHVAVWELSKDLLTWTPVIAGNNDPTDFTIKDADGNFIAGLNASIDLKGQGEDLTLLLYSCDNRGIANSQAGFRLDEYKLGTATAFEGLPTHITALDGNYGVIATNVCVVYDGEGGYWFGASRAGNAGQPNLAHINADGIQDYYTESINYYGGDGILIHNGMLLKGKDRTNGTVGNFDVYTLGKDQDGKPTLTLKYAVAANGIGRNLNDFAFDYAENLYAVGNSGEKIIAYAFPYSGVVTTPAAERYEYVVDAPEPATLAEVLEGKTIRRAVACDDAVYVLAIDAQKAPTLVKADFEGKILVEYATDFCSASTDHTLSMPLSDIALTADGVLVGCNADQIASEGTGNHLKIYKWAADGTGAMWLSGNKTWTTASDDAGKVLRPESGNFVTGFAGLTMAYNGTIAKGILAVHAFRVGAPGSSSLGDRICYFHIDGEDYYTTFNQDMGFTTNQQAEPCMNAALAAGDFVYSAAAIAPVQFTPIITGKSASTCTKVQMADDYIGISGFSFAKGGNAIDWMIIPAEDGATILDVTSGLATATVEDELTTQGITCDFMFAALVGEAGAKKVMLMRDADIELLDITTQPVYTNLNEVKAAAKAVKVMRNGHVFIIRDGKMFNMQGMMVK